VPYVSTLFGLWLCLGWAGWMAGSVWVCLALAGPIAIPGRKNLTRGRPTLPNKCMAPCRRFAVGSPTCSTLRHSNEVERLSTGGKQLPQSAVAVVAMGGSAETSYRSAQAVSQWARPDVELPRTATVAVVCHTSAHRTPFLFGGYGNATSVTGKSSPETEVSELASRLHSVEPKS